MKKIFVGNKVLCRLYNTPDKHYANYTFTGIVEEIKGSGDKREFLVLRDNENLGKIWVKRKEIMWCSYTTHN